MRKLNLLEKLVIIINMVKMCFIYKSLVKFFINNKYVDGCDLDRSIDLYLNSDSSLFINKNKLNKMYLVEKLNVEYDIYSFYLYDYFNKIVLVD